MGAAGAEDDGERCRCREQAEGSTDAEIEKEEGRTASRRRSFDLPNIDDALLIHRLLQPSLLLTFAVELQAGGRRVPIARELVDLDLGLFDPVELLIDFGDLVVEFGGPRLCRAQFDPG